MNKDEYTKLFTELGFSTVQPRTALKHPRSKQFPSVYFNHTGMGDVYFTIYTKDRDKFFRGFWVFVPPQQAKDRDPRRLTVIPRLGLERRAFQTLLTPRETGRQAPRQAMERPESASCLRREEFGRILRNLGFLDMEDGGILRHTYRDLRDLCVNSVDDEHVFFTVHYDDLERFPEALWLVVPSPDFPDGRGPFLNAFPKAGKEHQAFARLVNAQVRLTGVEVANFKGVGKDPMRIPLKPLTLIFGPNSAGKSTALHAMQYARAVMERRTLDVDRPVAGGDGVDLGGYGTLVHNHEIGRELRLRFSLSLGGGGLPGTERFAYVRGAKGAVDHMDVNGLVDIESVWVEMTTGLSDDSEEPMLTGYCVGVNGVVFLSITHEAFVSPPYLSVNLNHPIFRHAGGVSPGGRRGVHRWFDELKRALGKSEPTSWSLIRMADWKFALPDWDSPLVLDDDCFNKLPRRVAHGFRDMINQLVVCPGRLLLDELKAVRYLGPIRELPSRDHVLRLTLDESRWYNGLAAWDALCGFPDPRAGIATWRQDIPGWLGEVSAWLSQEDRLDMGYSVDVEESVKLSVGGAIWKELENLVRSDGSYDGKHIEKQVLAPLREEPRRRSVRLRDERNGVELHPQDVGIGVSQVIPVVVGAIEGSSRAFVVEQPELHLHPAVQCRLADLFISQLGKDCNRTFVIETHSEHMVLRLLRRIRETAAGRQPDWLPPVRPEDVAILYVERTPDGSRVHEMRISQDGELLDPWPGGFFEERFDELFGEA